MLATAGLTTAPVAALADLVDSIIGLPLLVLVLVALLVVQRSLTIVNAHEQYVVTDGDGVETVLDPGIHFVSPFSRGNERIDLRTKTLALPVEDATTSDGVAVTVEVSAELAVDDPAAAVTEPGDYRTPSGSDVADYQVAISERTGEAVTDSVERRSWDELVDAEEAVAAACRTDLTAAFDSLGVELASFSVASIERQTSEGRSR